MKCFSLLGSFYPFGKTLDEIKFSEKWHLQHSMETLWFEREYFGLLRNDHLKHWI